MYNSFQSQPYYHRRTNDRQQQKLPEPNFREWAKKYDEIKSQKNNNESKKAEIEF